MNYDPKQSINRVVKTCIKCYRTLVATGNARENGVDRDDWGTRKLHVKCAGSFRYGLMPYLNLIFDSTPRPVKCKGKKGKGDYIINKSEADAMYNTMLNGFDSRMEMLDWLESTALYEDKESPMLDRLFDKEEGFCRLGDDEREIWYRIAGEGDI